MRHLIAAMAVPGLAMALLTGAAAQQAQTTDWFPGVTIPAPSTTPSPNAFDDFHRAAMLEMGKDTIENGAAGLSLPQRKQLVADNGKAIDAVHDGLAHDYQPPVVRSFQARNTYSPANISLGRLLKIAGDTSREDGDWPGAVRYSLDDIHFGIKIQTQGYSMDFLSGILCKSLGRQSLWAVMDHLTGSEARETGADLAAWEAKRFPYAAAVQNDEWLHQGAIVNAYRYAKVSDIAEIRKATALNDPRELFDRYTSKLDAWIAASRQPFASRKIPDTSDTLSQAVIVDYRLGLFRNDEDQAEDGMLIVGLALRAYFADHKAYPDSLGALTPQYLAVIPADPFGKGEPLHYKSAGTAYRLYSVGPDGIDDGGAAILDATVKGNTLEDRRNALSVTLSSKGDIVAGVNF